MAKIAYGAHNARIPKSEIAKFQSIFRAQLEHLAQLAERGLSIPSPSDIGRE
jgi:hypothetical protein